MYYINECQLTRGEVFHIQAIVRQDIIDRFIQQSPNPHAWEIFNSGKVKSMTCLDL